ncbi:MAG TPA: UDP-N-acetyl-D-mannosamine dehydrogenase [Candidatus Hydrogenedens sp.]|nr:UDP-N-acetyl-D-mannosamine dehydrogenase [Candidatus Hydrogenedens sp.]HPP59189.1 UDP-N-acetyl-D-mannosamine dehydrogenase [Candidatus Hydrogenedens sp.]
METVCILGLGYIGLPTAGMLSASGYKVIGVDISERVVKTINRGEIHIEEPGLQTMIKAGVASGKLQAQTEPAQADTFIVAVPTPITEQKKADMEFVKSAGMSIVPYLQKGNLVILESTSPPGTCKNLLTPILEKSGLKVGRDLHLAHCPERVLPGKILHELIHNDRIIGGITPECAEKAKKLYRSFVEGEIFLTDATTAEMVKLIENTYRDVNIALANETAILCEKLGINFWEVATLANHHPRVHLHSAGPGVGGHCISVDPWFLVEAFPEDTQIIHTARKRNDSMPAFVVQKIEAMTKNIDNPKIALLGLAYKGNVDDIRESPSLHIYSLLKLKGYSLTVHDPHVKHSPIPLSSLEDTLNGADCMVILTAHNEFKSIDPENAGRLMKSRCVLDTHNLFNRSEWEDKGFQISTLGVGIQP